MPDQEWLAEAFDEHRGHLRAVAYRLLGSLSDADDAVQDTWLRLSAADVGGVDNLGAWLTTVVARVSLNMLRARRHRAEEPLAKPWPDGRLASGHAARPDGFPAADPEAEAELADSVGLALLVVLDTLTPAERLAFVLHDLFAMPFDEIGAVLHRSPEASRQLASRARRRVRGAPEPGRTDPAGLVRQREVAAAFLAAARGGDFSALVALLDDQVTLTADAFASPSGLPARLQGRDRVARGAVLAAGRAGQSRVLLADGVPGIAFAPGGRLRVLLTFEVGAAGTICSIEVIGDTARLRSLRLAILPE
jgi:RNA polymerase sigma-70 factor, ECF subfamily